ARRGTATAQIYPRSAGSPVLIRGKNVTSSSTMSIGTKNGSTPRTMVDTLYPVVEESTNSTIPTGGVSSPSSRLKITIAAKWYGSTPNVAATGARTGTRMRIADVDSNSAPTTRSSTLTMIRKTTV